MKQHKGLYPQICSFQNLLQAAEAAQRGKRYRGDVADFHMDLEGDIQKYFPSIDHEILLAAIERKIGCRDTLWLIEQIISGSMK